MIFINIVRNLYLLECNEILYLKEEIDYYIYKV